MKYKQKRVCFRSIQRACIVFSTIFCMLPLVVWAESLPPVDPAHYSVAEERQNWEVFTHRSNVDVLLLSDDGKTLWAGTRGGLEKRDAVTGQLMKLFNNLDGLPDNFVVSLLSDGNGGLWIGTYGGGLANLKSDGTLNMFMTENSGLPHNSIFALLSDGNGGLWIGTGKGGLAHFNADRTWDVLNKDNSELPDNFVYALCSDDSGGVWVGTYEKGLAHLKTDGSWDLFTTTDSGLPDNMIEALLPDGNGGTWIGTGGGLAHFKSDETWEIFSKERSALPSNKVHSLLSDDNGGVWAGTGAGLARLKSDGTWKAFNADKTELQNASITALVSGNTGGGIWIGTYQSGIMYLALDDSLKVFSEEKKGLPDNYITALLSDNNGGLWIGTGNYIIDTGGGGLAHFKSDGTWEIFNKENSGLPGNNILSLSSDEDDGLWIGMFGNGLAHFKSDRTWEVFNKENKELKGNDVFSLLSDGNQGLWIGTDESIGLLTPDTAWEFSNADTSQLPEDLLENILTNNGKWRLGNKFLFYFGWVWNSVYFVSDNNLGIWIGTGGVTGGDLEHVRSDGFVEKFNPDNSGLLDIYINTLLSDINGRLWIGTDKGLSSLKIDTTWDAFTTVNSGLPYNYVDSLLTDGCGGLWVGTGGLSVITGGGLAHFLLHGTPEQIIKADSTEITINWFLNASPLDYQNVKYIELQRSLSKDGVYETVLDESDNPVRFYADYSNCPKPRVDGCWVTVERHSPATKQNIDGSTTKGYTLNTPINDPEWLEGLPRYYRLSAVIEEDGKLVRVANNSEAALITPQVEEKPRVELTLDRNSIAMQPNTNSEITVFVSSLDLFMGDVALEVESGDGVEISNNINAKLEPAAVFLKSGETKPVLLKIDALSQHNQIIKIIPKTGSGYSGKSASLTVQVGDDTNSMIALSIARKTKRPRVLDALTISGNVIPALAGQKIIISGNIIKESVESSNASESADSLTIITDENGCFQGSVTPIHADLLTLTAQSNGITSNTAEIFILPARTDIALSSNVSQSTKKGDILRIQGIITPVRLDGTKVNLDIRYLDPADSAGGLQPQFVGDVVIDSNGVFYRDVVVPGDGFINVKAGMPETSDYLSVNTKLVIPIGQPVGEGIIVVSESGDSDFRNISETLGEYVYNTLINRNIPAERIKYLGLSGESAIATQNSGNAGKSNLHDAISSWAVSMMSADDPYKTPLNLYLIGKVEDGNFRLNDNEILTAEELDKYLDEAEEMISTNSKSNYSEYKGFPVTVVLEGTQSGQWIEKIAGNGRIILTSSSDRPLDEGGFAGYANLGESSFSRYFYQFINYGSDIEGSFAEADYEIRRFYRHTQKPVMDADGDGVGTTDSDRYEASGKFIEYRPSGNLRPQIRTTNPDMTINRQRSSGGSNSGYDINLDNSTLWAIATDPENEMQGVFCSITDPSGNTVNIEMNHDDRDLYSAQFDKNFPQLAIGCYQAVYYAKDRAGNVSLPEQKFLNVISSGTDQENNVPEPPELAIYVPAEGSMVTFSWSEVALADGYTLFYAPYPDAAYIGQIDMGKKREISFDGQGFAFYGAVKAYNSKGTSDFSNIVFFDLR